MEMHHITYSISIGTPTQREATNLFREHITPTQGVSRWFLQDHIASVC
jgi:hypothetical protein